MNKSIVKVEVFHSAFGDGFHKVAEFSENNVQSVNEELERAYTLTNTHDMPWIVNSEITELGEQVKKYGKCRSTSVDDYMRVSFSDDSCEWYRVAPCGFDKVEEDTEVEYTGYDYRTVRLHRYFVKMKFSELREAYDGYDHIADRLGELKFGG